MLLLLQKISPSRDFRPLKSAFPPILLVKIGRIARNVIIPIYSAMGYPARVLQPLFD